MANTLKKWVATKKSAPNVKVYLTEEEKKEFENHPSFIKSIGVGGVHYYSFSLNPDYKEKAPEPKEAKKKDN